MTIKNAAKLQEIKGLLATAQKALEVNKKLQQKPQEPVKETPGGPPSKNPVSNLYRPGPKLPSDDKLTQEDLEKASKNSDLQGFVCPFDNAAEMFLALVDDITPYMWQINELKRLCGYTDLKTKTTPSPESPLRYLMAAANGSGKDQVIIAAFSVWYACTAKRSRVVVTSASAQQIKDQTDPWIRWLFSLLNKYLGRIYVRSVRNYHAIPEIGCRVELHVTDEEGKAEGAHPDPGGRMAIIINEAKSVKSEIYLAMSRCSGYDTWIEVSSPGKPSGNFYEKYLEADKYPSNLTLGNYWSRRITGFDCPHLTEAQRLEVLRVGGGGETNPHYESSWLAQFSTINEDLVIHPYMAHAATASPVITGRLRFGLDIGGAGDPTVLYLINGNQVEHKIRFNESDLIVQTEKLFGYFKNLNYTTAEGYGDHNGLGQGVVDGLRHKGIKITGVYNQESAMDTARYINMGAELYFNIRELLINKLISIPAADSALHDQLTNRYFYVKGNGRYALESKKLYKKRNEGRSPDEADAFVLAFAGTNVAMLQQEATGALPKKAVNPWDYARPRSILQSFLDSINKPNKQKLTAYDIAN